MHRRPRLPATLAAIMPLALLAPVCDRTSDDPAAAISAALDQARADGAFHGVALVLRGDETLLARATGAADAATDRPNELDTPFRLASLTKLFTQAAILRLVEQHRLELDSPLKRYRPDFRSDPDGEITIRDLLTMRAGLPRELADDSADSGVTFDAAGYAGPFLDRLELDPTPAEEPAYSNVSYWVLGAVIEAVTHRPLPEALDALVIHPLKLEHTGLLGESDPPSHARPHRRTGAGALEVIPAYSVRQRYASGGMYGTARDLARFCAALRGSDFLSPASVRLLCNRFEPTDDEAPLRLVGTGHVPGFTHYVEADLASGQTIVLLSNIDITRPQPVLELARKINAALGSDREPERRVITVRSARDGLPHTALGRAATEWLAAIASADAEQIEAASLRLLSPDELDPAHEKRMATQLAGTRDQLGGFDVVGYLERSPTELFVVVRGQKAELRITFTSPGSDSPHIKDILLDIHR